MKVVSEIYSQERDRRATVIKTHMGNYMVEMYQGDVLIESRDMKQHNIHYAEDCASNWTTGIIKG